MNRLAASLALFLISSTAFAADPAPAHWYRIFIAGANPERSVTGSSSLESTQISATLSAGSGAIMLENIREVFAGGSQNLPFDWHPNDDVSKVYVPTRSIAYVSELPGDPAAKKP